MEKKEIIKKTIHKLQRLSVSELKEASDYIDYLMHKIEDRELTNAIQEQANRGDTFSFLEDEEELYVENDLQEQYN